MGKDTPNPDFLKTLFPDIRVEGYDIRPWSLKQTRLVTPAVVRIVGKVMAWMQEKQGIDWSNVKDVPTKDVLSALDELVPSLLEDAPEVLSVTLGMTPEEADEKDGAAMTALFLSIMVTNVDYWKSFFAKAAGVSAG